MVNVKEVWVCDECGEEWDNEQDALDCCRFEPTASYQFQCGECGDNYDSKVEAEECCKEEEEKDVTETTE
jgi:hypothetical protein